VPTARVTVSSNLDVKNIKVRYQGSSCASYPGQLMAVINSATIGISGGNPVSTSLQTGQTQVISVVGLAPLDVGDLDALLMDRDKLAQKYRASQRELYFAFLPREGHSYEFKFDLVEKDVVLEGVEHSPGGSSKRIESLPLPDGCKANKITDVI
jgi:hypothetical protein